MEQNIEKKAKSALACSIVGLLICGPLELIALILANQALTEINQSKAGQSYKRMARTARVIAIIAICVWVAVGIPLLISLVIFYTPGRRVVEPGKNTEVVARVNGEEITVADIDGNKRLLEGLIRARVVSQEAARLGLAASDAELTERIHKQFTDPSGKFIFTDASGKPDIDGYKKFVAARYGGVERYERGVRDAIAEEKIRAFVTAGVRVSDEEVQQDYKRKNTLFDLAYVRISADKLAEKIRPSDQELRNHYEQHKNEYRIDVTQKKIRYVFVGQGKLIEKQQISERDLRDEYDRLAPERKQAGVRAQQILLKVARKDLDSQVERKAAYLVAKARGSSGTVSELTFADLARQNSEDPATGKNGGFLSHAVQTNSNKADPPYHITVNMQPGEVTDPIKYADNWYILRRGESVQKTFQEARQELLVSLRNRRGYGAALKLAARAQERLKETKDPAKVAAELAAEANMRPRDMVKETPYVKPGDDVPDIGSSPQFEAALQPLNEPNDVGEPTGVKGGFAIPMLIDKKEPRIPEFEEVKDKIVKAVKEKRAKEQLEPRAKEIASSIAGATGVEAAGERAGFEANSQNSYKIGDALGKAGTSPALEEAIYALKAGETTKVPIMIGDAWVIVGATKRIEADLADFAKHRDQLTQSMLRSRQDQIFEEYIASITDRLKREGKIKIYGDVLNRIAEDEPEVEPQPRRLRLPPPSR